MKKVFLIMLSLLFVVATEGSAYAQNSSKRTSSSSSRTSSKTSSKTSSSKEVVVIKEAKAKTISKLSSSYVTVRVNGVNYYKKANKYYKKVGNRYILTAAPFGLKVSVIPAIHTIFSFNNRDYYCAGGVLYNATSSDSFEIVEPQVGMIVPELPEVNVREVSIDGTIYFEFENILYKQIPTTQGVQYQVTGTLNL